MCQGSTWLSTELTYFPIEHHCYSPSKSCIGINETHPKAFHQLLVRSVVSPLDDVVVPLTLALSQGHLEPAQVPPVPVSSQLEPPPRSFLHHRCQPCNIYKFQQHTVTASSQSTDHTGWSSGFGRRAHGWNANRKRTWVRLPPREVKILKIIQGFS